MRYAIVVAMTLLSCGGGNLASTMVKPPAFEPVGQAKCLAAKSQKRPLIVEWPAADRAMLEALAKQGAVTVRYDGCEMEILPRCRAPGSYSYTATTRKLDRVQIKDADELYAAIPLGAANLEAKLATAGELSLTMTYVGRFGIEQLDLSRDKLEGRCTKATHVITAMTAGAFELATGGSAEIGGKAEVVGRGGGAKSESARETLNRDGDAAACQTSSNEDSAPPVGCGALLRVEVAPLQRLAEDPAAPKVAGADDSAAAGVTKVHLASNVKSMMLVRLDPKDEMHNPVCRAPCDEWVDGRGSARFRLRVDDDWVGPRFNLLNQEREVTIGATMTEPESAVMKISAIVALSVAGLGLTVGLLNLGNMEDDPHTEELDDDAIQGRVSVGLGLGLGVAAGVTGTLLLINYRAEYDFDIPGSAP